jgi:hypothetical protein
MAWNPALTLVSWHGAGVPIPVSYLTPILLTTGISFGNDFYNTGTPDIKILLAGGIAAGVAALVGNIPAAAEAVTGIAWIAFVGFMIAPIQNPSPVANLLKISGVWTVDNITKVLLAITTIGLVATVVVNGSQSAQVVSSLGNAFSTSLTAAEKGWTWLR